LISTLLTSDLPSEGNPRAELEDPSCRSLPKNPSGGKTSVCTFASSLSVTIWFGLGDLEGVFEGVLSRVPDKAFITDFIEKADPNDRPPCLSSPEAMTKPAIKERN
jgi:hypothetical protein